VEGWINLKYELDSRITIIKKNHHQARIICPLLISIDILSGEEFDGNYRNKESVTQWLHKQLA